LANLISDVHSSLSNTSVPQPAAAIVEKQKPSVSVRKSVQDEQITCLEIARHRKREGEDDGLKLHVGREDGDRDLQGRQRQFLQE
ncbi:MucR family transcriptional regulator, partial [Rhizobium johnstonii]